MHLTDTQQPLHDGRHTIIDRVAAKHVTGDAPDTKNAAPGEPEKHKTVAPADG
jgi:hypothetical protein